MSMNRRRVPVVIRTCSLMILHPSTIRARLTKSWWGSLTGIYSTRSLSRPGPRPQLRIIDHQPVGIGGQFRDKAAGEAAEAIQSAFLRVDQTGVLLHKRAHVKIGHGNIGDVDVGRNTCA